MTPELQSAVDFLEPVGSPGLQEVQSALFARRAIWAGQAGVCNQGRTIFSVPSADIGFDEFLGILQAPPRVLVAIPSAGVEDAIASMSNHGYDSFELLDMLCASSATIAHIASTNPASPLPRGFSTEILGHASGPEVVAEFQRLQQECGLVPIPGWVLRGCDQQNQSIVIRHSNTVVGGICGQRFSYQGIPASIGFSFCVSPSTQGMGLGTFLNMIALTHAVRRGARMCLEVVAPGPGASRHINERCGLRRHVRTAVLFGQRGRGP